MSGPDRNHLPSLTHADVRAVGDTYTGGLRCAGCGGEHVRILTVDAFKRTTKGAAPL